MFNDYRKHAIIVEVSRVGINRNGGYMSFNDLDKIGEIEVVYGIHNIVTDKWYIGSTFNLHDRIRRHKYYLLKNQHHSQKLQRSFNKYGIESFKIIIIEQFEKLDIDQLIEKEIDYIEKYNSLENGYNMTKDCRIYKQFKLTKEQIAKTITKKSIPVICLTKQGKFIKEFNSITEAANYIGDQTTNISKACEKGISHSVKGFLFIYKKDYDPNKDYSYKKYIRTEEHKDKLKETSRNNKRTRKIKEYDVNGNLINNFNSISALERELGLKKDHLKSKIEIKKEEFTFTFLNRIFTMSKSYSYKDIV